MCYCCYHYLEIPASIVRSWSSTVVKNTVVYFPSVGTYAVMSVMIGGVTERLAPDSKFMEDGFNGSSILNVTLRDEERVRVAAAVTLLSGIFQVHYGSCSKKVRLAQSWFWSVLHTIHTNVLCSPADSSRTGPVWFRGDLPVRATGARLHHRCCYPCHRVPAQVHLWHQPRAIQWTPCTDLCEEELCPEDSGLHAASVHCRLTILQIKHMVALAVTASFFSPVTFSRPFWTFATSFQRQTSAHLWSVSSP